MPAAYVRRKLLHRAGTPERSKIQDIAVGPLAAVFVFDNVNEVIDMESGTELGLSDFF